MLGGKQNSVVFQLCIIGGTPLLTWLLPQPPPPPSRSAKITFLDEIASVLVLELGRQRNASIYLKGDS